jgi:hypothetical protein
MGGGGGGGPGCGGQKGVFFLFLIKTLTYYVTF